MILYFVLNCTMVNYYKPPFGIIYFLPLSRQDLEVDFPRETAEGLAHREQVLEDPRWLWERLGPSFFENPSHNNYKVGPY